MKFSTLNILTILICTFLLGCSSALKIEKVPAHLKSGKLYLWESVIKIDSKTYRLDEGFLVVNENPQDLSSRRLSLPVRRICSLNPSPKEPIFWLSGGPGITNMNYRPRTALLENHDFVLIGYRGVDGSTSLGSDEITSALKGSNDDLLSNESLQNIGEAIGRFSKKLANRGIDISHYTIVDVISDIETARKAFKYEKINLLSASYGTRVALVYGYLHPEVIFRSIMIGANPPRHFTFEPKKIDEQLKYYDQLYSADSSRTDYYSLSQSIRTSLERMPSRWSLFKLNPGKIKIITFLMLYNKQTAPIIFDCYHAAQEGDYSGLYALQRFYDFMIPSGMIWGDLFAKGSTDFDSTINYVSKMRDSTTIMGSPLSLLIWGTSTGHWTPHKIPTELNNVQPSNIQTLIISGSIDFSTPAEYAAKELLPHLPNGRQVILKEMGHTEDIFTFQRSAFSHLLKRFYDEGIVDDSKYVYDPMNFKSPMNFPLWVKILYPFVLLLSIF